MHNGLKFPLSALIIGTCGLAVWFQVKPQPHSVTITWRAPAPRPGVTVVGYSVYRRTSDGVSYVKIADRVPGPPYEDYLVSTGRTYLYVVTSVDQTGRESKYSEEARATIP